MGIDDEVQHVVGLEAKIHGLHGRKAAHKQRGHYQQHKRAGNLQPNQPSRNHAARWQRRGCLRATRVHIRLGNAQGGHIPTTTPASIAMANE